MNQSDFEERSDSDCHNSDDPSTNESDQMQHETQHEQPAYAAAAQTTLKRKSCYENNNTRDTVLSYDPQPSRVFKKIMVDRPGSFFLYRYMTMPNGNRVPVEVCTHGYHANELCPFVLKHCSLARPNLFL
mmetsp:Transcript_21660/g.38866  ORF Transcript_21660/g.38866 Transcript_21660/m.38866 type:complete len:130 (+) Transcript_21660:374-763(+)